MVLHTHRWARTISNYQDLQAAPKSIFPGGKGHAVRICRVRKLVHLPVIKPREDRRLGIHEMSDGKPRVAAAGRTKRLGHLCAPRHIHSRCDTKQHLVGC